MTYYSTLFNRARPGTPDQMEAHLAHAWTTNIEGLGGDGPVAAVRFLPGEGNATLNDTFEQQRQPPHQQQQPSVQPLPLTPLRVLTAPDHRPELMLVSDNTCVAAQLRDPNHVDCHVSGSSRRSPPRIPPLGGTVQATTYVSTRNLPAACPRHALLDTNPRRENTSRSPLFALRARVGTVPFHLPLR